MEDGPEESASSESEPERRFVEERCVESAESSVRADEEEDDVANVGA